jgi:3-dehydroquinate dehydratase-2
MAAFFPMPSILIINGPNLNLLGTREPDVYGADTLDDIVDRARNVAAELGFEVAAYQSNAEHDLIDRVHTAATDGTGFIVVNPGAYTHTSVALRDAFLAVDIPFIELHLSNTFAREAFRHKSYFSDIATACMVGLGAYGYELAVRAAARHLAS